MVKVLSLSLSLLVVSVLSITTFSECGSRASLVTSSLEGIDEKTLQHRSGDTSAASDLYGMGVRIGIYLQSVGMIISLWEESGKGYRIAISANAIGVLISWSILMVRKTFSFSEAYLVLSETSCFLIPGSALLVDITTAAGEIVGSIGLLIAITWLNIGWMWPFTTHYRQLPLLGTSNSGWFFARVRLDGGYRIFIIVAYSFSCIFLLLVPWLVFLIDYFILLKAADDEEKVEEAFKEIVKDKFHVSPDKAWASLKFISKCLKCLGCLSGIFTWVLVVAGCEMTIQWNGLTPENTLTNPGQTIPLCIGIIIAADGICSILKIIPIGRKRRSTSMRELLVQLEQLDHNDSDRGFDRHIDLGTRTP